MCNCWNEIKLKLKTSNKVCVCVSADTHTHINKHTHTDINSSARQDRCLYMILTPGRCSVLKVDFGRISYTFRLLCGMGEKQNNNIINWLNLIDVKNLECNNYRPICWINKIVYFMKNRHQIGNKIVLFLILVIWQTCKKFDTKRSVFSVVSHLQSYSKQINDKRLDF